MIVLLVAVTTIENLVVNLRAQHQRSANEVRQKSKSSWSDIWHTRLTHAPAVQQSMIDDDDIIAGPQKMSLRCPVSATAF